jgi:hypothetical protein
MSVIPDASSTRKGIAKLSVNPLTSTIPIAVGDNDPRNTDARYPSAHHTTHESGGNDEVIIAESQVTNLVYDLSNYLTGYGFFGTGADSTVIVGAGSTTLTRDMHYLNLTVPVGSLILSAGYRIYVQDTLTLNGIISDSGSAGGNGGSTTGSAGGSAGLAASTRAAGYLPAPTLGVNGGAGGTSGAAGSNGSNGTAIVNSIGASGIAGKQGGFVGGAGGAAGAATALAATSGGMRNFVNVNLHRAFASTSLVTPLGHGGNGGSGGGKGSGSFGGGGGGASGGNGGYVNIFARTIQGSGSISVIGGAGGAGGTSTGGGGGGGGNGGNGGYLGLIYRGLYPSVNLLYTGGALGLGGSGSAGYGTDGSTGSIGILIQLPI